MPQQPRRLIVNADDFGMSVGINEGIIGAHRDGILTSTSLMVHKPAVDHAIAVASPFPGLSVGLHLDLCEWVYEGHEWRQSYEVVPLDNPQSVKAEIQKQLALFQSLAGKGPSHIDSHQHVHRSEPIRSILLDEAHRLDIPVREESVEIKYCGAFYGQTNKGEPYPDGTSVDAIKAILRNLLPGTVEMGCHPARFVDFRSVYSSERLQEFKVLCDDSVKRTIREEGIQLVSFYGRGVH